ncbi:MAG: glycosyltransferase family 4 protein [Chloroflexi bacterium]|nr:glycosyltransferase family 4 protein [Chloroflexota bacterium]
MDTGRPHAALISYCYYRSDPMIRRPAEALAAHGYAVTAIGPRQPGEPAVEWVRGVRVWRVGGPKYRGGSLLRYAAAYGAFFLHAAAAVARLQRRHGLALVQAHSMPEALLLAGLLPHLQGVPLVYYAGELTVELYAAKFGTRGGPLGLAAVRLQERLGLALADLVVTIHDEFRRRLLARGLPPERVHVALPLPDDRLFRPDLRPGEDAPRSPDAPFTLVHHGTLAPRYGADVLVEAVALLRDRIPQLRLRIYGDGDLRPRLRELIARHALADRVELSPGYMPIEELPRLLAAADAGVVPNRADPFTETVLSNKLLEYLALGLPTIVTRTPTQLAHVPPGVAEYCAPDDPADLARSIHRLYADPAYRASLAANARAWSAAHRWRDAAAAYCATIDALVARHGRVPPRPAVAETRIGAAP